MKNKKMGIFAKIILFIVIVGIAIGGFFLGTWWKTIQPVVNEYVLNLKDETGKPVEFQYGAIPSLTNPDYYKNVRQQLIDSKANFIDADLATMQLAVYKQGVSVLQVKIAAKGKVGTWNQTPSGLYKAETKEPKHRSSFEPVFMNWNIPFQGNYFIHGWPTDVKTGKPVTSDTSAGCIRLTDVDAKKVYDLADVGMPILVHEEDVIGGGFSYTPDLPTVSGRAYLAADLSNNFVFLEQNQNLSYPLDSFAKLLNAFVVSEYMNVDRPITITKDVIASTSIPRLAAGQQYTPYDLIFPMVLEDSNEAAEALAKPLGRARFITLMNEKAKALGMIGTAVVNPSGLGSANVTTPRDLFQLAKAVRQYRQFLFDMTHDLNVSMMYGPIKFTDLHIVNPLSETEGYKGGMLVRGEVVNGTTTQSVIAAYELTVRDVKRNVVIVSLNSEKPVDDVKNMVTYIKQMYR